MKRDPKVTYQNGLKPHYTWFEWCKCEKCNLDFRREHGFLFTWLHLKEMFLCGTCSQGDIKWANDYVLWLYQTYMSKKPQNPPKGR